MIDILFVHSKTSHATKIIDEFKAHLAPLRRQKNLVFTQFLDSEDGNILGFYRKDMILTAQIRVVAIDKELMSDDTFVNDCIPTLLNNWERQLTIPFLIAPVANPELIPLFEHCANCLKNRYMVVESDTDMVQLAQAIRTVVEKM
jgi:hypothetical protein